MGRQSKLTNICIIQSRHLFFNRIGGGLGNNLQGYAQIVWKNRVRGSLWLVMGVFMGIQHSQWLWLILPNKSLLIRAAFALDF